MNLSKETEQRNEFRSILLELSKSQEKLQDTSYRIRMYKRLEALYDPFSEKPFRHFYSDIFSVLTDVKIHPELGDINILGQNLDVIRNGYQPRNIAENGQLIDISDAINKLYDHVNLDIARILYSDAGDWKLSGEENILNLKNQLSSVDDKIVQIQKNAENIEEKIENQQREYISILGIFAAVVLAFTGGIAFSTSIFENISQISVYRILIVGLVVGLILVNILFGLFYYINKIVCKEEKLKPLVISNAVIFILIVVVILAWGFGVIEQREKRIYGIRTTAYESYQNIICPVNSLDIGACSWVQK
ncbi:MAG: hypothetical protein LUG93_15020 [Lachnospiraceae bacterium]|nr:hypothetical protein [Lachnospiraceae bacterium]